MTDLSAKSRQKREKADNSKAMKIVQNRYLYTVLYEKADRFNTCIFIYHQLL